MFSLQWLPAMRKRLTSLVLLLMLTGSALAGMPLHSSEEACSMDGAMGGMDCCKIALLQSQVPEVEAARLCCAIECATDGTAPSTKLRLSPQSRPESSAYPTSTPTLQPAVLMRLHTSRSHGPPTDSHPAYIRNLALLI